MKNASCYLHGRDLRPSLCHDCARVASIPALALAPTRTIKLTAFDFQALERVIDAKGKISFRERLPIPRADVNDPWAYA